MRRASGALEQSPKLSPHPQSVLADTALSNHHGVLLTLFALQLLSGAHHSFLDFCPHFPPTLLFQAGY